MTHLFSFGSPQPVIVQAPPSPGAPPTPPAPPPAFGQTASSPPAGSQTAAMGANTGGGQGGAFNSSVLGTLPGPGQTAQKTLLGS